MTIDEAYRGLLAIMPAKTFSLQLHVWRFMHRLDGSRYEENVEVSYRLFITDDKATFEDVSLENILSRVLQYHSATAGEFPVPAALADAFESTYRLPPAVKRVET